jgi:hypothetical protein
MLVDEGESQVRLYETISLHKVPLAPYLSGKIRFVEEKVRRAEKKRKKGLVLE